MFVTYLALAILLASTLLSLAGLRMIARDTVHTLGSLIGHGPARMPTLAFAALWALIFCLALA